VTSTYVGRFAPSPSGPLHAGSLVAALGSWLDAQAHAGRWLLRIEDVDTPRMRRGAGRTILRQLEALGLMHDGEIRYQSSRGDAYQRALDRLVEGALAYPCGCTRRDIDARLAALGHAPSRGQERVYPGTCRGGLHGKTARAWRVRVGEPELPAVVHWHDRRLGALAQDVTRAVGDFVLRRADGPWAYQLAVVVDDAAQGITHVVRGEDLADNTARQIFLQRLLGLPTPRYLHLPLVLDARGEKLSKSNGATALVVDRPADAIEALRRAAQVLGLPPIESPSVADFLARTSGAWRDRYAAPLVHDATPRGTAP
jgi:glutamyl-Q tRNA(Asp) synthetase